MTSSEGAPAIDPDGDISREEEDQLYRYYGLQTATGWDAGAVGATGTTDDEASIVRSEEHVDVGTRRKESGRVRLRKYVVTEDVTTTVPVEREEVRVEREPISEAEVGATRIGEGEDAAEVTLHEDEVVVDKTTKPVERVSLDKDTVTEQEHVTEQVRKEQVQTEAESGRDDLR